MATDDRVPEDAENLADPFWQVIFGAANAEMGTCERALIAQRDRDDEWYRNTWKRLEVEGLTEAAFSYAITREMRTYLAHARARCVCSQHREGGLR